MTRPHDLSEAIERLTRALSTSFAMRRFAKSMPRFWPAYLADMRSCCAAIRVLRAAQEGQQ